MLNYLTGERISLQLGDGRLISVYVHNLELQLGTERFIARVGFSEQLGVGFNVLGRASILERFRVCFDERQGILTFEPHSGEGLY